MPSLSAGLLVYRKSSKGTLELLLAHPGGPYWTKKDDGAWSLPKGEYSPDEDPKAAALREFSEELGQSPPASPLIPLGELKQPSGKRICAWATEGDIDVTNIKSNTLEIDWPPRSGKKASFPEIDRVEWFSPLEAKTKLHKGQVAFVDHLLVALGVSADEAQGVDKGSRPHQEELF